MWWLPGIFRDVTLLERPPRAIDDLFVLTSYDHRTGGGTLLVEAADVPARLRVPELRAFGRVHVAVHRPGIHRDHALTNPPASDSISLTNVFVNIADM